MTDEKTTTPAHGSGSVTPKPAKLTPEQIAAMTPDERQQLIEELNAVIAQLNLPVPQPYPKWVEIDGVNQIVESEEEEKRKEKAAADFHKDEKKHEHEHEGNKQRMR